MTRSTALSIPLSGLVLSLCLVACGGGGNDQDAGTTSAINEQAINNVIIPGNQRFAASTLSLRDQAENFCAQGADIDALQLAWLQAMSDWQSIQLVNFGPADEETRLRVQFYPDERGRVATQVDDVLADSQPITVNRIANATAPLQGLPALEYLIFARDAESLFDAADTGARRCDLLLAISSHLSTRSADLLAAWQADAEFRVTRDIDGIADLTEAVITHVVFLRDDKLGRPLGIRNGNVPQPQNCESALSGSSSENLRDALSAIETLFTGMGDNPGLDDGLIGAGYLDYLAQVLNALGESRGTLDTLTLPFCEAIADDENRDRLFMLFDGPLRELRNLMQELPGRLAVNTGFNANDGD